MQSICYHKSYYIESIRSILLFVSVTAKVMDTQMVEPPSQQSQVSEWSQLHSLVVIIFGPSCIFIFFVKILRWAMNIF